MICLINRQGYLFQEYNSVYNMCDCQLDATDQNITFSFYNIFIEIAFQDLSEC